MTKTDLRIARGLTLPLEAVTEAFGVVGRRGSGKTSTSVVIAEEMQRVGVPFVVCDPKGDWWGIRSNAEGDGPGLPVAIVGGSHGDVPLEETGGAVLADLLVDSPTSLVLDLSDLRKGAMQRFMTEFLERLYARNRDPLMVILDEADLFAPQSPRTQGQKGGYVERLIGACEDLVRRGRGRGLGVVLVTQRPAVLNKNVLTQIEVMVAHQLTGPQDIDALDDWIRRVATPQERAEFLAGVASLPVGGAFWWSPSWLGIFEQHQVRQRHTFDSSRTPRPGQRRIEPRALADVDLERLKQEMAETIERAEADDPKKLRARIAELDREIARLRTAKQTVETIIEYVDRDAPLPQELLDQAAAVLERAVEAKDQTVIAHAALADLVDAYRAVAAKRAEGSVRESAKPRSKPQQTAGVTTRSSSGPAVRSSVSPGASLGRAERAMLTVFAQFPEGRTKTQIGILSGYSIRSSVMGNTLSSLRTRGLIDGPGAGMMRITSDGAALIGEVEQPPRGPALLDFWLGKLGRAERALLPVLMEIYPEDATREYLEERTGYSASSSVMGNTMSTLRGLGLVEGWHAHPHLWEACR